MSGPVRTLLSRVARPRWRSFGLGAALLLVAAVVQRVPALVIGVALDALLADGRAFTIPLVPASTLPTTSSGRLLAVLGVLGAAVAVESAARWAGTRAYDTATFRTLHDLRVETTAVATALPMAFHDERADADLLSVVNDDVDNLADLFAGLRDGLGYATGLASAFAFMALLNWQLSALLLAVPLALVVTGRVYARLLEARYDAVREAVGDVNVRVRDAIRGLATVKAYTREPTERAHVAAASADYRDAKWAAHRLQIGYNAVSWLFGTTGIWGLFLVGGYWALAGPPAGLGGSLTAGSLLTFLIYAEAFLDPTRRLAVDVIDRVESAQASARRVTALLDRADGDAPTGTGGVDDCDGALAYEGVTFGYGDDPTVEDVTFSAEAGDFVGIVGATGAGKSTLARLLFRFYDPDAGHIWVDGTDVTSLDPRRLREHLALVGQDPFLVPGTVAENVAYADPDPDRDAVEAAARQAAAHDFVAALPDGYDTHLGDRGASLSGGQRQRLAIARALYADPAILVLDEATSHVDTETEAAIQRSLQAVAGERTVLAIAHRLATVRDADTILVLDDGRLVESGTHEELLERDGRYAALWRTQTGTTPETPPEAEVVG